MSVLFSVFSWIALLVLIIGFVGGALTYFFCNAMDGLDIGKDVPSNIASFIEDNCEAYFILAGFAAAAWVVAAIVLVATSI